MQETRTIPLSYAVAPQPPRASVLVVNYNGRRYLDVCLGSLLADGADCEIILLDNASHDGSAEYVEQHYPQVRVIRSAVNGGFAEGNNQAAREARGEYLAFLNPDTRVEPGWLDALIAVLESDHTVGLVTPQIRMLGDPERINTCGNEVHCSGLTLCRGVGREPLTYAELTEVSAVSGAAFAMRKDLFLALGGFDTDFFMYMEDTDLSWRARLAGFRCAYVPSSVVYHDYRLKFGPYKTFYQERNRYLILLKTYRWPTLLAMLPAYALAEVVTWGFVLTRERGRAGNKVRVYGWTLRNWRKIMASRRHTQSLRRVPDRALLERCTYSLAYEQTGAGPAARVSHVVFDPLFRIFQRLALAVIRW